MIVTVDPLYPKYGPVELNVDRIIAISSRERRIYFEYVYWYLDSEDFQIIADAWRSKFTDK